MATYIVKERQTLLDIALETTGSPYGALAIADMSGKNGITDNIQAGEELQVPDTPINGIIASRLSVPIATKKMDATGIDFDRIGDAGTGEGVLIEPETDRTQPPDPANTPARYDIDRYDSNIQLAWHLHNSRRRIWYRQRSTSIH